jgi:hypothetical protein
MSDNATIFVDIGLSHENEIYLRILLFVFVMCSSCLSICLGSLTSFIIKLNRALPQLLDVKNPPRQLGDIENANTVRELAARACGDAIEMAMNIGDRTAHTRIRAEPNLQ